MAINFRKFLEGIRIIPKASSSVSEKGDLEVLDSTGKLNYHNGSSASPVVTESHSATLTNKTLDSASLIGPTVINVNSSSAALRVTQTGAGDALLIEDSANPDSTPFRVDQVGNVYAGGAVLINGQTLSFSNPSLNEINFPNNATIQHNVGAGGGFNLAANYFNFLDGDLSGDPLLGLSLGTGAYFYQPATIGAASLTPALRITQTGTGDALRVEDSANPDSTPFVINANGDVGIGMEPLVGKLSINSSSAVFSPIGSFLETTVSGYTSTLLFTDASDGSASIYYIGANNGVTPPSGNNYELNIVSDYVRISSAYNYLSGRTTIESVGGAETALSVKQNSTAPALSVTQTGTGLALLVEDQASPDATPFVVDATGKVGVGTLSPTKMLHVTGTNSTEEVLRIETTSALINTLGVYIGFGKTVGQDSARIGLYNNTTGFGSSLVFYTNSADTGTATERVKIQNDGNVAIGSAGAITSAKLLVNAGSGLGLVVNSTGSNDCVRITQTGTGACLRVEDSANPDATPFLIDANGNVGIGTGTPHSGLQVVGSLATNYTATAANVTIGATDFSVALAATTGTQTATLPSATGVIGRIYSIKRTGTGATSYTVAASGAETIDGASTYSLPSQYSKLIVQSNGTNWNVISDDALGPTSITTISSTTTLTNSNEAVLVNAASGAVTVTLPAPSSGKRIIVKKIDSSINSVTISRSSTETIDGATTKVLIGQYDSYTLISNGTNWFII